MSLEGPCPRGGWRRLLVAGPAHCVPHGPGHSQDGCHSFTHLLVSSLPHRAPLKAGSQVLAWVGMATAPLPPAQGRGSPLPAWVPPLPPEKLLQPPTRGTQG